MIIDIYLLKFVLYLSLIIDLKHIFKWKNCPADQVADLQILLLPPFLVVVSCPEPAKYGAFYRLFWLGTPHA